MTKKIVVRSASNSERDMLAHRIDTKKTTGVNIVRSQGTESGVSSTKILQRLRRKAGVPAPVGFVRPK